MLRARGPRHAMSVITPPSPPRLIPHTIGDGDSVRAVAPEPRRPATRIDWQSSAASSWREYVEVAIVLVAITVLGWFVPITYHAFGQVYLLAVMALSLRVGRGAAFFGAIGSAVAWNYVFIPPQLSFSVLDLEDGLMLGTYLVVALIGGLLSARIRAQERIERLREQRATALFHLTRALAGARTLDEALQAALAQANELFGARTALLLALDRRTLRAHDASSLALDDGDRAVAEWAWQHGSSAGRFTTLFPSVDALHLPLVRAGSTLGVLAVCPSREINLISPAQLELMEAFAAQIALLVEREQLRAASEREKFFQESDRLHRTLLDSVSHELKTPLAVLRSTAEKWTTDDPQKRAALAEEMGTAMRRLDHLVANLLNQTRLEAGDLRAQLDWCDARDLIAAARRTVGDALARRPVSIELPPDLPLFMTDAGLMEQVLANLLLNAAQHTPAGGPITVCAGYDAAAARVFIAVLDRGPGLPPELHDRLFQKFRRGAGARAGGLGLGLSIVRGFMQAQRGHVEVASGPEGGTKFTVYLPHVASGGVPGDER
jgi:K+-sensing histidine kinase KdpD